MLRRPRKGHAFDFSELFSQEEQIAAKMLRLLILLRVMRCDAISPADINS